MASRRKNDSWENQWLEKYVVEYALELVLLILIFGGSVFKTGYLNISEGEGEKWIAPAWVIGL